VFSSDRIRKQLAGVPPDVRPEPRVRAGLYSEAMTRQTYDRLIDMAAAELETRRGAILDATFRSADLRQRLVGDVERRGGAVLFLELAAPNDLIRRRLAERERSSQVASDARLEDFDALTSRYEPPSEIGAAHVLHVDSSLSVDESIAFVLSDLAGRRMP